MVENPALAVRCVARLAGVAYRQISERSRFPKANLSAEVGDRRLDGRQGILQGAVNDEEGTQRA